MTMVPCPHCGADIRANARFCRNCGSSDADGWREGWQDDGSDDDDFDYDAFVEENFSDRLTNPTTAPLWRLVAVVLLIIFVLGFLLFLF